MLQIAAILDAVTSHAAATGYFDRVTGHEPKAAPGTGITLAAWVQQIGPVPKESGLRITSGRIELMERIYSNMLSEPQDEIDPNIVEACDGLLTVYSGDFTLGGLVNSIDLLGRAGTPLSARAGYLDQDGYKLRVMDITLPCIVHDLWEQAA